MAEPMFRDMLSNVLIAMSDQIMASAPGQSPSVPSLDQPKPVPVPAPTPMAMPGETEQAPATPGPTMKAPRRGKKGAAMDMIEVARLASAAGFTGEALVTAVAVAKGESGLNPAAMGDTTITDATWGPSVGLMQIRSFNKDKGTGATRDQMANLDPATNMRAAFAVSGGGKNFKPWTIYKTGAYKQYLDEARAAVAALGAK